MLYSIYAATAIKFFNVNKLVFVHHPYNSVNETLINNSHYHSIITVIANTHNTTVTDG